MLKSRIPEITHLSPETGRWNAVYAGTKNGWFEVRGVYPDYFLIKLLEVEHGRMLNALDMNEARKVVLIGEMWWICFSEKKIPLASISVWGRRCSG